MFGGCTKYDPQLSIDKLPMIANTAVLTLGEGILTQIHSHARMPSRMHAHTVGLEIFVVENFRGFVI